MRDVFAGKPDGIAIHSSSAIVAPPRTNGIHFREVAAESILAGCPFSGNMHVTGPNFCVERNIPGAGIMVVAKHGETNHATSAGIYADRRIGHIVARQSDDALGNYTGRRSAGMKHEERDASLLVSVHGSSGVKCGPEFAVGV